MFSCNYHCVLLNTHNKNVTTQLMSLLVIILIFLIISHLYCHPFFPSFIQVTNTNYLVNYRDIYHNHGLVTTSLGLNIPVDGRHFYDGMMRVRCVASLSPSLWQNGKESVVQRRPALMDNREAMLLGKYILSYHHVSFPTPLLFNFQPTTNT